MRHRITPAAGLLTGLIVAAPATAATYLVTNINNSGTGSLRLAIVNANASPGTDFIEFDIPGSGVHTILPTSPLPVITGVVSIDGSSQPGFAGIPRIELGGDLAGTTDGLVISNNSSQIGWLTLNGWDGNGIRITGSGNAAVVGCYIGIDNDGAGVTYPNTLNGIYIDNSPNNDIGGTTSILRNVITGNTESGVRIEGSSASGNHVSGNYVGLDRTGGGALGNDFHGIYLVSCAGNTVGGGGSGAGNVSAGNNNNIRVQDCLSPGNTVWGNRTGVNATGTAALGGTNGIVVIRSSNTVVQANHSAGNSLYNIDVGTFSEGTVVYGNLVGTDATGMTALGGGGFAGVSLFNVCNIEVGSPAAEDRNVISGNVSDGVYVWGSSSFECGAPDVIRNNLIGVAADGATPLGNGGSGIAVSRPSGIVIGGNAASGTQVIAHNGGAGVLVDASAYRGPPSHRVHIERNLIFDNDGLGIDLSEDPAAADGVTPNDPGDADTGANDLQNFPVITSAEGAGLSLTINGYLDGLPDSMHRIEIYGATDCDASGHGEGRVFLAAFTTVSASGYATFGATIPVSTTLSAGWFITATARNLETGDTSEFGPCAPLASTNCNPDSGSCYAKNGTPGCASGDDCCDRVCDIDPYCCDTIWDDICVTEATQMCAGCGTEAAGDCFTENGTPGCYHSDCCAAVCAFDPYCCETMWDDICAEEALSTCALPCRGDVPFISPGAVDVQDLLFVLAAWGQTGPPRPRADVYPHPTGDDVVDIGDLLEILANWGLCP